MASSTIKISGLSRRGQYPNGTAPTAVSDGYYVTDSGHLPSGSLPSGFNENGGLVKMQDIIIWVDIFGNCATYNRYYSAWRTIG